MISDVMSSEIMTEREMQALVAALAKIVGPANVLERTAARKEITGDMSWLSISAAAAGNQLSRQDAVATVTTTEQVAQILKLANELGIPVTPFVTCRSSADAPAASRCVCSTRP